MEKVVHAVPDDGLRSAVVLELEVAGYTVAEVVNSTLTFDTLQATPNPVVVILNETAPQCIVVELASQSGLALQLGDGWPAIDRYTDVAVTSTPEQGPITSTPIRDMSMTRPIPTLRRSPIPSGNRAPNTGASDRKDLRRRTFRIVRTVLQARIARTSVVAQLAVFAALGLASGLASRIVPRSWWVLALVPAAYVLGMAVRVITRIGQDSPSGLHTP